MFVCAFRGCVSLFLCVSFVVERVCFCARVSWLWESLASSLGNSTKVKFNVYVATQSLGDKNREYIAFIPSRTDQVFETLGEVFTEYSTPEFVFVRAFRFVVERVCAFLCECFMVT